jgi:hypothetical protein
VGDAYLDIHQDDVEVAWVVAECRCTFFSVDGEVDPVPDFLKPLLHDLAVDGVVFGDEDVHVVRCRGSGRLFILCRLL